MTYGPVTPKPTPSPETICTWTQIQAVKEEIDRLPPCAFQRRVKLLAVLATLVEVHQERRKRQIRRAMKKTQPKTKDGNA